MPYIKPALRDSTAEPALIVEGGDTFVIRDLGNDLLVLYLVDVGESFQYVQRRHLTSAGITTDELHATAMANLERLAAGRARVQRHGWIHALFLDGNFEASLLLLDDLWDRWLATDAPNGYVVAVPARDMLAFTDAGSVEGVAELRGVIDRVIPGGDHLISSSLYQRVSGRWVQFPGEPGAPADGPSTSL